LRLHPLQETLEGIPSVDVHLGGDELHRMCYNLLWPTWLAWSGGYEVPLASTTLRGVKGHTAIAGKFVTSRGATAQQRDALSHSGLLISKSKSRGGKFGKFGVSEQIKYEPIELAVVISQEDLQEAQRRKEGHYDSESDNDASTSVRVSLQSHSVALAYCLL